MPLKEDLKAFFHEPVHTRFSKQIEEGADLVLINPRINVSMVVMLYAAAVQSIWDSKFAAQFPESIRK